MRKILFLDFDGVLNSENWCYSPAAKHWYGVFGLDSEKITLLDEIVERTGCEIVISSSWRAGKTVADLKFILSYFGMKNVDAVVDKTPYAGEVMNRYSEHLDRKAEDVLVAHWDRGLEIFGWLLDHAPQNCSTQDFNAEVSGIAIVDDNDDMWRLLPKLVKTTWKRGMNRKHVEALCWMLGEKEK